MCGMDDLAALFEDEPHLHSWYSRSKLFGKIAGATAQETTDGNGN